MSLEPIQMRQTLSCSRKYVLVFVCVFSANMANETCAACVMASRSSRCCNGRQKKESKWHASSVFVAYVKTHHFLCLTMELPGSNAVEWEDAFKLLGIDERASESQIRTAYRKRSLQFHPDKARDIPPDAAAERFHRLTLAYDCLLYTSPSPRD